MPDEEELQKIEAIRLSLETEFATSVIVRLGSSGHVFSIKNGAVPVEVVVSDQVIYSMGRAAGDAQIMLVSSGALTLIGEANPDCNHVLIRQMQDPIASYDAADE